MPLLSLCTCNAVSFLLLRAKRKKEESFEQAEKLTVCHKKGAILQALFLVYYITLDLIPIKNEGKFFKVLIKTFLLFLI